MGNYREKSFIIIKVIIQIYRNPQSRGRAFFPYFFGKIKGAASVNIYNLYKKYKKI